MDHFRAAVAPILEERCLRCHSGAQPKGGLDLSTRQNALAGGDSGPAVVPGKVEESLLPGFIEGERPEMPKGDEPLSAAQIQTLRKWIAAGAQWPEQVVLRDKSRWWSLERLRRPTIPPVAARDATWMRSPVDGFLTARMRAGGLEPSPPSDRRTLIRRLTFDLHGLPPTPEEIDAFVADTSPDAYERLVDRLLASPRYGERWGRHWLDVAHYADTHGYDKDKRRPHAWPYRDWIIRALNADKPYDEFAWEQIAGDTGGQSLARGDGIVATGFLAAGPWDFVGHVELREGTVDKEITRNLDRDDVVTSVMSTFTSFMVHCARCHDHKFDPIPQDDYYSLQAVFAGIERANRAYEPDPAAARRRGTLERRLEELAERRAAIQQELVERAGPQLEALDKRLDQLAAPPETKRPEYGYHSQIEPRAKIAKWVQVDLGREVEIAHVVYLGCHDDFAGIGAGFGFPPRYRIEISNDPQFATGVVTVVDHTADDVPNPGCRPQAAAVGRAARYVRMTATKLAPRSNDFIFALAELAALDAAGTNLAAGASVSALDSIEAPVRWAKRNLVDGIAHVAAVPEQLGEMARLQQERSAILDRALDDGFATRVAAAERELQNAKAGLAALAPPALVFAAATRFEPQGNFTPPPEGRPRSIHVLARGNVTSPLGPAEPGALSAVGWLPARFDLADPDDEAARRAALADWIVDRENPRFWRSMANRLWHYHFGRGLVDTPNDFGRMGSKPTHPELLDWLACELRDRGGSLKTLHRLIVTSSAYRQSSAASPANQRIDPDNRLVWRMNRRRLEAEAVRDAAMAIAGTLRQTMHGPGYDLFGFEDDHSPRYDYRAYDVDNPATLRRTVYRFVVRSVPDPFMETLDCPDPSINAARRNTTITPLQALALLNNRFMVRQAEHFAARVTVAEEDLPTQLDRAMQLAFGRSPTPAEALSLADYARRHGLANTCRVLFNANEFLFVD
ncbi:MAG: DUF1553 domain-containing protein [Planctomycetes bacterium]|nr:DUF1553 domain-containing protein [Planctomycetota bacterium]